MRISRLALSVLAVAMLLVAPGRLHAALLDIVPVYRIQLGTTTCDLHAAGTDNAVRVRLNPTNSTWLDYSHNDFERGASFTYDLGLESITLLGDISMLEISKTGRDSWCLRRLTLHVNNALIFEKVYSPSGRWLDTRRRDRRTLTITGEQLRRDPNWAAYTPQLPPDRIRRRELESRIESAVGDALHGQKLTWRRRHGRAVELRRVSRLRYRGDIHLEVRLDNWPDPEVDVSFRLAISCGAGRLAASVRKLKLDVDSPWFSDVATLGALDEKIEGKLRHAIRNLSLTRSAAVLICPPALGIMRNGDLRLY